MSNGAATAVGLIGTNLATQPVRVPNTRSLSVLVSLYYASLRAAGCTALIRRFRNSGVVLCYHNVVDDPREMPIGDSGLHIPLHRFRSQMSWLATHYDVVSLRELLDRRRVSKSLRRTAAVTFDDAYSGVLDNALPVLRQLNIPATVFVVAEAPERDDLFWWDHPAVQRSATRERRRRWLGELRGDGRAILRELHADVASWPAPRAYRPADWQALAAVARDGFEVGVHSATHRSLPQLGDAELRREIIASRAVIENRTGVAPRFFAYPYGLWDERVRATVQAAGYEAAYSLDYGLVGPAADSWALPRVNVPATIRLAAFQAWTAGLSLRHTLLR